MSQTDDESRPVAILVSGMPASGKSTLTEQLAAELGEPFFFKDGIKEILFDAGELTEDALMESSSDRLGAQAIAVLYDIGERLLTAGISVVLEANFRADEARVQIEPLRVLGTVRQVARTVPVEQIVERFEQRQGGDERHPVHAEVDDPVRLMQDLERKDYGPIPGIPTLIVDTSDGVNPPLEEIVAFCRGEAQ